MSLSTKCGCVSFYYLRSMKEKAGLLDPRGLMLGALKIKWFKSGIAELSGTRNSVLSDCPPMVIMILLSYFFTIWKYLSVKFLYQ